MFAFLGGAVTCRLGLQMLRPGMELLRRTSGYISSGPAAAGCVFSHAGFGILVASVCFQFPLTIGSGCCCCSPSMVLEPLGTLLSAVRLLGSHVKVVLKFLI